MLNIRIFTKRHMDIALGSKKVNQINNALS